jgi:hypothetical protein
MPSKKKMGTLEQFYIDNNLHLTDVELARTTGCSVRQIKARRNKGGLNREGNPKGEPENLMQQANPERQNKLQKEAVVAAQQQTLPAVTNQRPQPAMRIDALIARRNGTTSLTGPASELADMFDGIGPDNTKPMYEKHDPFADPERVHKIKP